MTKPYLVSLCVVQIVIFVLLAAVVQRRRGETFHILNHLQFEQNQTILGGGRKSYFMKKILHKCGKTSPCFWVGGDHQIWVKKIVSQYLDLDFSLGIL